MASSSFNECRGVFLTSPLLGTLNLSLVTPLSIAYSIVVGKVSPRQCCINFLSLFVSYVCMYVQVCWTGNWKKNSLSSLAFTPHRHLFSLSSAMYPCIDTLAQHILTVVMTMLTLLLSCGNAVMTTLALPLSCWQVQNRFKWYLPFEPSPNLWMDDKVLCSENVTLAVFLVFCMQLQLFTCMPEKACGTGVSDRFQPTSIILSSDV